MGKKAERELWEVLRMYREGAGWSVDGLAKMVGVSNNTILTFEKPGLLESRFETAKRPGKTKRLWRLILLRLVLVLNGDYQKCLELAKLPPARDEDLDLAKIITERKASPSGLSSNPEALPHLQIFFTTEDFEFLLATTKRTGGKILVSTALDLLSQIKAAKNKES